MTEPHRNIHSLPHKWRAEMFCLHWSTGKNINQILFKLLSFLQDPVLGPTLSPEAAYSPSFRVAPWEEVGIRVKHPWLTLLSQEEPLVAQKVKSQPEMWFDPWVGKIPGGRHGNTLHYSSLENPMDRGAWWAPIHRLAQSWTWLKRLSSNRRNNDGCT